MKYEVLWQPACTRFCAVTWWWAVLCAFANKISRWRAVSVSLTLTHLCSLVWTSEPHPLSSVIDVLGRPGLCLSSAPVRQLMKALQSIHTCFQNTSNSFSIFAGSEPFTCKNLITWSTSMCLTMFLIGLYGDTGRLRYGERDVPRVHLLCETRKLHLHYLFKSFVF